MEQTERVNFPTPCNTPRPIRTSEQTRRFAARSLAGEYGRETLAHPAIVREIPNFFDLPVSRRAEICYLSIAEQAPVRHVEGELLVGAATLGTAIRHRIPFTVDPKEESVFWSYSHLTANFDRVLREGTDSFRRRIAARMEQPCTQEQTEFLKSLQYMLDALGVYHKRYMQLLEQREAAAQTQEQKAYYADLRENLALVPFAPPKTFRQGLQALWFTFSFIRLCGSWPGIGRIDVMLNGLLEADLAAGRITQEQARELTAHFFIKGCEWVNLEFRGSGDGQHYQNIVLGGIDESGKDQCGPMTRLVLEIVEEFPIGDFPIAVRVNEQTPKWMYELMARVIRHGSGVVAIYNEKVVLQSLVNTGYDEKEATHFANDGCWEVQIPGKTRFAYYPRDLYKVYQDCALCLDGREIVEHPDFESLYAAFLQGMRELVDWFEGAADGFILKPENMPIPALIALFEDSCIEHACDYECGGPVYVVCSLHVGGIPDIANSMLAVKKLVYEEKKVTLSELIGILKNDWQGHEDLRQYVRGAYQYYGNDSDEVDGLVTRIIHDYCAEMEKVPQRCGVIRTAGISTFGRQIDWKDTRFAHAHGFRCGDILAGNISPTPSTDCKGATAIIRSCCKADYTELRGGTTLDIRLDPTCVNGAEGLEAIEGLLRGFCTLGGYFMQVDVVDTEVLREAQKHPEQYQSLAVRVSGWSARFVTLDEDWQRMIIERTEQEMAPKR